MDANSKDETFQPTSNQQASSQILPAHGLSNDLKNELKTEKEDETVRREETDHSLIIDLDSTSEDLGQSETKVYLNSSTEVQEIKDLVSQPAISPRNQKVALKFEVSLIPYRF